MQPYFFPYIGYYQLISHSDLFIVYDDIEYTKKGWINRNRVLVNGEPALISLPLRKASDYLNVNQREISPVWPEHRAKILNKLKASYEKAPYYSSTSEMVKEALFSNEVNLFGFLMEALKLSLDYIGISTKIVKSSDLEFDRSCRSQEKVIAICGTVGATSYLNLPGGVGLYRESEFMEQGFGLKFLDVVDLVYSQGSSAFVPNLSIIDVLMFNSAGVVKKALQGDSAA